MSSILNIENELTGLVKLTVPPNRAIVNPNGAEFFQIEGKPLRTANVWVIFAGSNMETNSQLSASGFVTTSFNIHIAQVNLRTHTSAYELIELVTKGLHGRPSLVVPPAKYHLTTTSALEYDSKASVWKTTLKVEIKYASTLNACIVMDNPYGQ